MTTETLHEVGIRIHLEEGIAFFGIEAANRQLALGRRIKEIRPGGAIITKLGENGDHVRVTLGGCDIVLVFDGTEQESA